MKLFKEQFKIWETILPTLKITNINSSYGYPSSYAPPGTATYSSGGGGGYEDNSDDYYVDEEVDAPWNRDYDDEDQVRVYFWRILLQ